MNLENALGKEKFARLVAYDKRVQKRYGILYFSKDEMQDFEALCQEREAYARAWIDARRQGKQRN